MKVVSKNYIQGLASFLDEMEIDWRQLEQEQIEITVKDAEELFRLGFEFGKFYEQIN